MNTFTSQEPMTGDLHSRTEQQMPAIKYFNSPIEQTLVFNRRGKNEEVNLGISHFDDRHELTLTVFNMERGDPVTIHEQINLSYHEARMLKNLLNRPEVTAWIEQDFH